MSEVAVRERPILFSPPMVRAILDGRKTMTRRVCPQHGCRGCNHPGNIIEVWNEHMRCSRCDGTRQEPPEPGDTCPYGVPGDRLWVREAWRILGWHEGEPIMFEDRDGNKWEEDAQGDEPGYEQWYERMMEQTTADCESAGLKLGPDETYRWEPGKCPTRWRPGIHMPRWGCRLVLEVTSVRVERLQEISEADARAEGVYGDCGLVCSQSCGHRDEEGDHLERWDDGDDWGHLCPRCGEQMHHHPIDEQARQGFRDLWDSINGKSHPWASNPWVWVVSFRRIKP